MGNVRQRCLEVFANVFEIDPLVITDETSPENLPAWDSLAHVQLIQALEQAFSVAIPPDDGIDFETFKMVCDWLERKL